MFHPFNVVWFSFEHILINSATLPFLLLSYERNLNTNKFLNKYLIACALLQGLIFLSGHFQVSYYTAIFFILFAVFKFIQYSVGELGFRAGLKSFSAVFAKHIFSIVFIFLFALIIASIVLIPFLPFVLSPV